MLVNIHHDSKREHNRLLVAGVVFLTGIALLIALSIAVYQKRFDDGHHDRDPRRPRRAPARQVRRRPGQRRARGPGARGRPGRRGGRRSRWRSSRTLPARSRPTSASRSSRPRCSARSSSRSSSPTTRPRTPWRTARSSPSDRVETNVELSRILADLFPLLRAVEPADLNTTLNALATALGGRGEQLGETLDELDAYLAAISDKLPTLREDLISLANVADIYDLAAPDLIDVLGNLTVTSKTIIEKAGDLDVFFSDLQGLAVTSTRVLVGQRSAT